MTDDSPAQQKYKRGENPRSLANLRPWGKGEAPENANNSRGPLITPRIRRMAQMEPQKFFPQRFTTVADIIAAGYVFEAMQSGYDRGREQVINRLDGAVEVKVDAKVEHQLPETVVIDTPRPELRRVK